MICSGIRLQAKLRKKFSILLMKGYPECVIKRIIAHKLKVSTSTTSYSVKKCHVYLHLLWLKTSLVRHESKIKASVEKCFFAVKQLVIFTFLPATEKDVLPASLSSNVIYNILCHCNSQHVSRTSQRLQNRIL